MSEESLLQRAKRGNTDAIASTINYLLKNQNIHTKAIIDDRCLKIILESKEILDREILLPFIHKFVIKLEIKTIDSVRVYATKVGGRIPFWTANIPLNFDRDKPQKQNQGQFKQLNKNECVSKYPIWLPYPSSLWRTLILTIMGLPLVLLSVSGIGLIILGFTAPSFNDSSYAIIAFGIIMSLISTLIIAFFHSVTKLFLIKIIPEARKMFDYSNNLWEGLYGTIIMFI
jgi:hypothetical protein